jgi:cytoskeletal protein CcmA (bactofilin family)
LKSQAHVVGDIHHQSLAIESGAYFDGRSIQVRGSNGRKLEGMGSKRLKQITSDSTETVSSTG